MPRSLEQEIRAESTLLAYWILDEASGSFLDRSGNNLTMDPNGTLTRNDLSLAPADARKTLKFGGGNLADNGWGSPFAADSTRTYEFWLARNSTAAVHSIFGGGGSPSPTLRCENGSNDVSWYPTSSGTPQSWADAIKPGVAHQLVLTWNDSTKAGELWVDAVSQGAKTFADKYPSRFSYLIGSQNFSNTWDGWMGHHAIFSVILPESRIRAHYRAGFANRRRAGSHRLRAA